MPLLRCVLLGKSVGKEALQHLSIILAFCAVFGLAAYRVLDSQPASDTFAGVEPTYTATIPQSSPAPSAGSSRDLSSVLNRVAALETQLQQMRTQNRFLEDRVRQLIARDSIITSSIGKQPASGGSQFRTSTVPSQNGGNLPRAQGGLGIHLATFADPAALTVAWNSLKDGEEAMLSRLSPFARAIISSSGERLYRLIAGPVPTRDEAASLCQRMKARNRFCKISEKLGTPLAQVLAQN